MKEVEDGCEDEENEDVFPRVQYSHILQEEEYEDEDELDDRVRPWDPHEPYFFHI